ncbi:hypothetical protein D3C74_50230 [compost metagenome]
MGFLNNDEDLGRVYQNTGIHFYRLRLNKRVRKEHICMNCGKTINKGSPSAYHSGLMEGKVYHYHDCWDCYQQSIMSNLSEENT